jgi:hypothetical protein
VSVLSVKRDYRSLTLWGIKVFRPYCIHSGSGTVTPRDRSSRDERTGGCHDRDVGFLEGRRRFGRRCTR